jgi:hypothetical protein
LFKNLQAKFDGRIELPIEVQDICDALVEMGYQDDIRVVEEEMDLTQLLGTYVQFTEPNGVYGEPNWVSLIVYPSNVGPLLQRQICAKELVHVCDAHVSKTKEPNEIMELAQVLCGRASVDDGLQISSMKVAADILAQSKGLMLLFPKAARVIARQQVADGTTTLEKLEQTIQIPKATIEDMLEEDWEVIADLLSDF